MSTSTQHEHEHEHDHHPNEITIDKKPYRFDKRHRTARQLLERAGKDPAQYYLVELIGKHEQVSYKDGPDAEIELRQHSRFITVSTGDTPVS